MTSTAVLGASHLHIAASAVCGRPASRRASVCRQSWRAAATIVSPSESGKLTPWLLADRRAEGVTLLDIGPALVERGLRGAEHLQADQRAAEIEALHHLHEAGAFVGETVARGNDDIVEEDR